MYLDVNDVSDLVGLQVGGQMLDTLLFVGAREHVASTATVTLRIRHCEALTESRTNLTIHGKQQLPH